MSGLALAVMLVSIFLGQVEGVVVKEYGKIHKIEGMFFNAIICAFAGVFFIVKEAFFTAEAQFYFPLKLMPYAVVSCIMYAIGFGLIVSFALSVFLYKEKFTKVQVLSVAVGFVAFVLFQVAPMIKV